MKNYLVVSFVLLSLFAKAQEIEKVSVEKNLNSVQAGLLSLSYQNEIRLDRKITLKSEIGLELGLSTIEYSDDYKETSFLILPFIIIEPRWYYGLDRRSRLNKNTRNNTSNYFSLLTCFHSSKTALINSKNFEVAPSISIVPEYGIRRNVGNHFFSEYSGGIGFRHDFINKNYVYKEDKNGINFDFQLKFGYIF